MSADGGPIKFAGCAHALGTDAAMVLCVFCETSGELIDERLAQRDIHKRIGGITIVGAIPSLSVVVVGSSDATQPVNPLHEKHPWMFHEVPRGRLALVASDARGDEVNVDRAALARLLA